MKNVKIAILLNLIVIILLIIFLLLSINVYRSDLHQFTLICSLVPLISFIVVNHSDLLFKSKYLRISYFFLFGFLLVFFQKNLDLAFGIIDPYDEIFCSESVINNCAIMSVIGLSSFCIGNFIGVISSTKTILKHSNRLLSKSYIVFQRLLFFCFSGIYFFYTASEILSGNYFYNEATMEEKAGSLSNYANVMIYVLVFTLLLSRVYNSRIKKETYTLWKFILANGSVFNIILVFYLILQFMTGDRGPILTIILAYSFAYYAMSGKNFKLVYAISAIIVGAGVLTAIGQLRSQTNMLTLSDLFSYEKNEKNETIFPLTNELACSYNTFTYTVNNVPSSREYFSGMMQVREVVSSVPFLHRYLNFIYSPNIYENSSTDYCTYLIQGLNRTYGNGSSLLANIYLDFGLIGIMIIMLLIGRFTYRLDCEVYYGNSIYWQLMAIIVFSFSLYLSRATLTTPLYYMLPSFVIIYMKKYFKS